MPGQVTATIHDALLDRPAVGLRVQIYWVEPHGDVLLRAASTTDTGTTAAPLVSGSKLSAGVYKLVLHVGDYFQQTHGDKPRSFDVLPVVFVVDDAGVGRHLKVDIAPDRYAVQCG